MKSEVTYGTIVDPSKGPHEQAYPISRKIPPGDVERFHIMIGSPMSCHLKIQFKFFIDQTQVIESDIFDIDIFNPVNSQWHHLYPDAISMNRNFEDEIMRINHFLNDPNITVSDELRKDEKERIKWLKGQLSIYPLRQTKQKKKKKRKKTIEQWLLEGKSNIYLGLYEAALSAYEQALRLGSQFRPCLYYKRRCSFWVRTQRGSFGCLQPGY